jgi:hypothetical protein
LKRGEGGTCQGETIRLLENVRAAGCYKDACEVKGPSVTARMGNQ